MQPRFRTAVPFTIALAAFALLAGCARSVAVESEPGPRYAVEVRNTTPADLIVSYEDDAGTSRLLGTVPARGSERFTVVRGRQAAGSSGFPVTIIGTDEDGAGTITRRVTLYRGETTTVTLAR